MVDKMECECECELVPWMIDTVGDPSLLTNKKLERAEQIPWIIAPNIGEHMSIEFIIDNMNILERTGVIGITWYGYVIDIYLHYNKPKYSKRLIKFINGYIWRIRCIMNMYSDNTKYGVKDFQSELIKYNATLYQDKFNKLTYEINMNKDIVIFIYTYICKTSNLKYVLEHIVK